MQRRDFITNSSLVAIGAGPMASAEKLTGQAGSPVLRIAHFTDSHLEPQGPSVNGVATALHKIQALKRKPDLIFTGGDTIFDGLKRDKPQVKAQWNLWKSIVKQENSLPLISCIGNHDVWGWGMKENKTLQQDKLYGKQWATEELQMPHRYYSFDKAGWHFIVLDSVHFSHQRDYVSKLDDEQFEWLTGKLKSIPAAMPVCILSHIPIVSFASAIFSNIYLSEEYDRIYQWGLMHLDVVRIKDLFYQHPNIRLCLSGHLHLQEIVEYLGVKYICGGAISGNWWKGNRFEFAPAFSVVDLYADGTSAVEFVVY